MKVTFQTKAELIEHSDFYSLGTDTIELNGCEIPIEFLGETMEVESFDENFDEYTIDGHTYELYQLEEYATIDGEWKTIDIDGDTLQYIGDEFKVACKTLTNEEMLEIVNFVIDIWGYQPVVLP